MVAELWEGLDGGDLGDGKVWVVGLEKGIVRRREDFGEGYRLRGRVEG